MDPDGNEVQFTEYAKDGSGAVPLTEDHRESCSAVRYTTQVAFQVQDAVNMVNFYCLGLGLKKIKTLTYGELCDFAEASGMADEKALMGMRMMGDRPWIDYIEVAPHQYIELFHTDGQQLQELQDLSGYDGYQHICLEVSDIHAAWDACIANSLKPDTEISWELTGLTSSGWWTRMVTRLELMGTPRERSSWDNVISGNECRVQ